MSVYKKHVLLSFILFTLHAKKYKDGINDMKVRKKNKGSMSVNSIHTMGVYIHIYRSVYIYIYICVSLCAPPCSMFFNSTTPSYPSTSLCKGWPPRTQPRGRDTKHWSYE